VNIWGVVLVLLGSVRRPPIGGKIRGGARSTRRLSMRPNCMPNVTVISKRRVCVGSTRSRHPSFDGIYELR
jgi:hypothetical protein